MSDDITEQQPEPHVPDVKLCKNCASAVAGYTYCPVCGQKTDTHVLTFRELLEELADGLLDMDSRLWRSLLPLIAHPGRLTREYLAGRRMYYLPPFRLYLILSVVFFLIPGETGNVGQRLSDGLTQNGSEPPVATGVAPGDTDASPGDENVRIITGADLGAQIREDMRRELAEQGQDQALDDALACDFSKLDQDSLFTLALRDACLRLNDDPDAIFAAFVDSIPVMMIVGIPLVALMMQLLYAFSHHYYVEHIIFLFHVHAFFFLISITMSISSLLGQYYPALFTPMDWYRIAAAWYIPAYMLLAMKRVYGEGTGKTILKACLMLIGYTVCILIVGGTGFLITAIT